MAGPILRHVSADALHLWLVTRERFPLRLSLRDRRGELYFDGALDNTGLSAFAVGQHCVINLIRVTPNRPLPAAELLEYDIHLGPEAGSPGLRQLHPELCYTDQERPVFCYKPKLDLLYHGSCRKPHCPQPDALPPVAEKLAAVLEQPQQRPALLLFSGDQIYADDVAGPMLSAIHQVIDRLGLCDETWDGARVNNSRQLRASDRCYYQREQLLPRNKANQAVLETFFRGVRKPIITAAGAFNHLITFSEVIAMYLLVWSDTPWQWVDWEWGRSQIPEGYQRRFVQELEAIDDFRRGLPRVRRLLAHVPVYMIFDDHDVTDDWNLTRGWEEAAYGNAFSRGIIGNALAGYWLCQGWGNQSGQFATLQKAVQPCFTPHGIRNHDQLVDQLLAWENWHYRLPTSPKLVVADTRTHRWRSETSPGRPSGLMDWESLSALQQELIGEPRVILVSAAPVFGVKLIETVQRIFTFFGQALTVDAENWMAHPGAAAVMLNIFRHSKTPPQFIILSGDVHYSFAFDVTLRFHKHSSRILQVTASGLKNRFPPRLLQWFDVCNRWLFASRSPLNWLTKRRRMLIRARRPDAGELHALYNHSGMGVLQIGATVEETRVVFYSSDGKEVHFRRPT